MGLEMRLVEMMLLSGAAALGINASLFKNKGSRTKVRKVFFEKAQKENVDFLQGTASSVVTEFLNKYQRKIKHGNRQMLLRKKSSMMKSKKKSIWRYLAITATIIKTA